MINTKTNNEMRTLTNTTGTKAVNISTDGTGTIRAMYVQIYNGEEQVLESKSYSTMKRAEKWATSKLN